MEHGHHNFSADSAMTEIALALAMGFFSIMVLTMVSMGAGSSDEDPAEAVNSVALAPAQTEAGAESGQVRPVAEDVIIIYFQGRYLDQNLSPLALESLPAEGRLILAVAPDLPMVEAMAVRARINRENLIVSTLDERWMKALGRNEE